LLQGAVYAQENDSLNLVEPVFEQDDTGEYEEQDGEYEYTPGDDGADETEHVLISPAELNTTQVYQSETVTLQKFDETRWKEIVGNVTFEEEAEEEESTTEDSPVSLPPWGGMLLKIISYIIIIAIVIFLLYYVIKSISFDNRINRATVKSDVAGDVLENIEEADIDGLLAQARSAGNFKLAVRFYFLSILKKLHNSGIIAWKRDKTNRDYLYELFSRNYYFEEIRRLTNSYEEVWYGEHVLSEESFQVLTKDFERVHDKLKTPPVS
jgi:hypothetical protein